MDLLQIKENETLYKKTKSTDPKIWIEEVRILAKQWV